MRCYPYFIPSFRPLPLTVACDCVCSTDSIQNSDASLSTRARLAQFAHTPMQLVLFFLLIII